MDPLQWMGAVVHWWASDAMLNFSKSILMKKPMSVCTDILPAFIEVSRSLMRLNTHQTRPDCVKYACAICITYEDRPA